MATDQKKAYVVREPIWAGFIEQLAIRAPCLPDGWKQPAVWVFPDLEQARAWQEHLSRKSGHAYEIEEIASDAELESQEKPPRRAGAKVYVVQQLFWEYNDNWYDLDNDEPVRAFTDPELAEVYRLELEAPRREAQGSPIRLAGAADATSLSEEQLRARLTELGVEPPPDMDFHDDDWWSDLEERSLQQFHQVWDLFDRVRFFEVVAIDLDR